MIIRCFCVCVFVGRFSSVVVKVVWINVLNISYI